jgi:DNA-binding PadR family transcriptional regulator
MLAPLDLVIVVTLSRIQDGTHGYDLLQTVRAEQGSAIATTTLYRALRHLLERGLVAEVPLDQGEDPRRRRYRVTDAGVAAATAERIRLATLFASSPRLAGATP